MQTDQPLSFGPYRLDPGRGQLCRGTQEVKLTLKALAVLRLLVERSGQVVSKEEFFRAVWADTVVSDAALTSCIQELRQALRDDARSPRYIETVHRRGFRFIGKGISDQLSVVSPPPAALPRSQLATGNWQLTTPLVGRETELGQLHQWLEKALHGERQVVFVTGEPGIGKTTLVDAFLQTLDPGRQTLDARVGLGRGQCIEHYGAGEAYLPLLEVLGRLCRGPEGKHLIQLLHQHAPTWLVQMPALLRATELEALQRKVAGATKERMLRELAEAIEVLTTERPLVLWLEDLHWSDMSTLDWLALVARRQERARLVVIGTYRPVDVLVHEHPLKAVKQELQLHGHCQELALDFLREEDVAEYLATRFGVGAVRDPSLRGLAGIIHRRTDGNPLFMVNVVDALITQGVVTSSGGQWELTNGVEQMVVGIPDNLQQMIEQRLAQVNPTARSLLEVASVVGVEFSAAAVAAGVETTMEAVEEQCAELARRESFLRACGTAEWPDGTVATRYGFLHALYQEVLYERLPAGRRKRLHQQIGEREEAGYGERAREIATELAVHFERGREFRKTIQYLQQAGETAMRRSANHVAISLLTKGLELLKRLPDTPERTQQELTLQVALGSLLGMTQGYAAPEVEKAYVRARELCQQVEETPQLFWILYGLCGFYVLRAEYQTARGLAEQLLSLAQRLHEPALLVRAHQVLGLTLFWLGELAPALEHLGIAPCDPQQRHAYRAGPDPRVVGPAHAAFILWLLGYPDQALKRSHEALTVAQELSHPFSLAVALNMAAVVHWARREVQAVQARAEAAMALATEQGFAVLLAQGTTLRGWALVEQGQGEEGVARIGWGLTAHQATGTEAHRPSNLAQLAEAYGKVGRVEEGLNALAEALAVVDKTGERYYEAELYRLKGTLTLQSQTSPKQVPNKSKASPRQVEASLRLPTPSTQHLTPTRRRKPKRVFRKPLRLPASNRRSRWSCAR